MSIPCDARVWDVSKPALALFEYGKLISRMKISFERMARPVCKLC
jgi:hypothetical protein